MEEDGDCNIRVICRFRPINDREREEGADVMASQLKFHGDSAIDVAEYNGRPPQNFNFDKVFWDPATKQEDVYNLAARKSIEDVIKGYNATIFAYGQTGAGKSWTMFGNIHETSLKGIIPRSCMHIFDHIRRDTEGTEYTIKCSFLEIYKETIRDLLNPATHGLKQGLKVRELAEKGVWVEGLKEEYVTCEDDVINLIMLGEKYRAVSSTRMNASSSRSHSLFILSLHQKSKDGSTKEGRLNLADLAGSEKVGKTGATGDTLEEAKKINQSLSALGNCINALTKSKKGHIPYRDSKLTFILRESLGGNCKTTLLVACSPHIFNLEETVSTLQFAKRAKTIKNSVKVNKQRSVAELMAIIEKIKKELSFYKKYIAAMEGLIEQFKGPDWKSQIPKLSQLIASASAPQQQQQGASTDENDGDDNEDNGDLNFGDNNVNNNQNTPKASGSSGGSSGGGGRSVKKGSGLRTGESSVDLSFKVAEMEVEYQKMKESSNLEIRDLKEEFETLKADNETNLPIKEQKKLQAIENLEYKIHCTKEEIEEQNQLRLNIEQKFKSDSELLEHFFENYEKNVNLLSLEIDQLKMKAEYYSSQLEEKQSEHETSSHEVQIAQQQLDDSLFILNEKEQRLSQLLKEKEETTALRVQLEAQCDELLAKQTSINAQSLALEQTLTSLIQTNKQTDSQVKALVSENAKLRATTAEKREKLSELQAAVLEAKEELIKLQEDEFSVKQEGLESIEELRHQTVPMSEYQDQVKERDDLKLMIEDANSKLKALRQEISSKRYEIEEAEIEFKTKYESISYDYDQQLSEYRLKVELLDQNLSENDSNSSRKISALEEKLNNWVSRLLSETLLQSSTEDKLECSSLLFLSPIFIFLPYIFYYSLIHLMMMIIISSSILISNIIIIILSAMQKVITEKEVQVEKNNLKKETLQSQLSELEVSFSNNTSEIQSYTQR